jgi:hypothetical protein
VDTLTCPQCGSKTDYDPEQVGREMRTEERDGRPCWCVYCRARCALCGREELVLKECTPLP